MLIRPPWWVRQPLLRAGDPQTSPYAVLGEWYPQKHFVKETQTGNVCIPLRNGANICKETIPATPGAPRAARAPKAPPGGFPEASQSPPELPQSPPKVLPRVVADASPQMPPPPSPLRFRHGTRRGSDIEKIPRLFFMLENDEQNHCKMLSESVSIFTVFRVIFYENSSVRGVLVCVSLSLRLFVFFGMADPRSARAGAVETQFLNFRFAV